MIHYIAEGGAVRLGLNWRCDRYTVLLVKLVWRWRRYGYALGFQLRRPDRPGRLIVSRSGRWLWDPYWIHREEREQAEAHQR